MVNLRDSPPPPPRRPYYPMRHSYPTRHMGSHQTHHPYGPDYQSLTHNYHYESSDDESQRSYYNTAPGYYGSAYGSFGGHGYGHGGCKDNSDELMALAGIAALLFLMNMMSSRRRRKREFDPSLENTYLDSGINKIGSWVWAGRKLLL